MDIDWDSLQKFSDFAEPHTKLEGDKVKIENILNREIAITGFRIAKSKIKENQNYLTIQFMYKGENEPRVVFTGSQVLSDQIREHEVHIPFVTMIKKVGNYYCLY